MITILFLILDWSNYADCKAAGNYDIIKRALGFHSKDEVRWNKDWDASSVATVTDSQNTMNVNDEWAMQLVLLTGKLSSLHLWPIHWVAGKWL